MFLKFKIHCLDINSNKQEIVMISLDYIFFRMTFIVFTNPSFLFMLLSFISLYFDFNLLSTHNFLFLKIDILFYFVIGEKTN